MFELKLSFVDVRLACLLGGRELERSVVAPFVEILTLRRRQCRGTNTPENERVALLEGMFFVCLVSYSANSLRVVVRAAVFLLNLES